MWKLIQSKKALLRHEKVYRYLPARQDGTRSPHVAPPYPLFVTHNNRYYGPPKLDTITIKSSQVDLPPEKQVITWSSRTRNAAWG